VEAAGKNKFSSAKLLAAAILPWALLLSATRLHHYFTTHILPGLILRRWQSGMSGDFRPNTNCVIEGLH